jgi:Flp pilus assembly protein TadD
MKSRILFALTLLGCASSPRPRAAVPEITSARDALTRAPDDTAARLTRALAELTAPGGDTAEAQRALDALHPLTVRDPAARFARGLLLAQHGDFEGALTAYIAAVDAARETEHPLGPAIAEVCVGKLLALRGDVRDFATPFAALLTRSEASPGHLGAAARVRLFEGAVRWAREAGRTPDAHRWTERAGCATGFRVAGPFGPLPNLSFDRTFPPESPAPLAASYDAGPGRGHLPTYTVRARGCAANLGRGVTLTGVLYASADFTLERAGDVVVYVESPNSFAVLVDGARVATLDPRTHARGSSVHVPLRLTAGHHTLRVKVASGYHSPLLMAAVTDPAGVPVARFSDDNGAANPAPPTVLPAPAEPADDAYLPAAQGPATSFGRYVFAELAFSRRHVVAARELLRPIATDDAAAATLIAWAGVAQADPFRTVSQQRDRARQALEAARRRDPQAYFAPLQLARLTAQEERGDEALALVREAYRSFPDNPEVEAELADRLLQRNWEGEAREVLEHARARDPNACWPARMLFTLAERRGDGRTERALGEAVRRCDALSELPLQSLRRSRRWDEAAQELTRMMADEPDGRSLRRSLSELARMRGDLADALQRGRALLPEMPEDDALRADLADLAVATGSPTRPGRCSTASSRVARGAGLALPPARPPRGPRGPPALAPRRPRGAAGLRGLGRSYESAAVLVLDYTVRRTYPDGSALELTHNVVRVQSQEGVDAHGEFQLPPGATLWRIRTLKADGRVLEPEEIAGKDSLSLPDLRPGDAVEFEYVRCSRRWTRRPEAFSDRFYFRGFEVPYDRSEYVVVVPRGDGAHSSTRGAPRPTLQRAERGGLIELPLDRAAERPHDRRSPLGRAREFIPERGGGIRRDVGALRRRAALAAHRAGPARPRGPRARAAHHPRRAHPDASGSAAAPLGAREHPAGGRRDALRGRPAHAGRARGPPHAGALLPAEDSTCPATSRWCARAAPTRRRRARRRRAPSVAAPAGAHRGGERG